MPAYVIWYLIVIGPFFLCVSLIVAVQAKRRGYSLLAWTIAGMLGNPVLLLVMLGIMPNFARKQKRIKELLDIEDRMSRKVKKAKRPPIEVVSVAEETMAGIQQSTQQSKKPPEHVVERSLGDEVTNLPDRSLGDYETRM